jgi:hypothetical protein
LITAYPHEPSVDTLITTNFFASPLPSDSYQITSMVLYPSSTAVNKFGLYESANVNSYASYNFNLKPNTRYIFSYYITSNQGGNMNMAHTMDIASSNSYVTTITANYTTSAYSTNLVRVVSVFDTPSYAAMTGRMNVALNNISYTGYYFYFHSFQLEEKVWATDPISSVAQTNDPRPWVAGLDSPSGSRAENFNSQSGVIVQEVIIPSQDGYYLNTAVNNLNNSTNTYPLTAASKNGVSLKSAYHYDYNVSGSNATYDIEFAIKATPVGLMYDFGNKPTTLSPFVPAYYCMFCPTITAASGSVITVSAQANSGTLYLLSGNPTSGPDSSGATIYRSGDYLYFNRSGIYSVSIYVGVSGASADTSAGAVYAVIYVNDTGIVAHQGLGLADGVSVHHTGYFGEGQYIKFQVVNGKANAHNMVDIKYSIARIA